ncbi:hypothetical protein BH24ACT5_BH24ACT5_01420 [soil metagenome]
MNDRTDNTCDTGGDDPAGEWVDEYACDVDSSHRIGSDQ